MRILSGRSNIHIHPWQSRIVEGWDTQRDTHTRMLKESEKHGACLVLKFLEKPLYIIPEFVDGLLDFVD